jgi:hypothetical protein
MKIFGIALPRVRKDWRKIIKRAWSVRLMLLAALFGGVDAAIQAAIAMNVTPPIEPGWFAILAGVVSLGALGARVVAQKGFDDAD